MSRAQDVWQPHYLDNAAVGASGTTTGPNMLLQGASGVSVQVVSTNGAAGTVYLDVTNQDGTGSVWVTPANQALAANGSVSINAGPADQATAFAQMRVRFVASAAGNISISTNVRRYHP